MKWSPDETPDFPVLEPEIYRLKVDGLEETGGNEETPLRMDVTFRVQEPAAWIGFPLSRRFFLGTKEDPKAELPQTRRGRSWTAYKNFLKALGVTPTGDTDEEAALARGAECLAQVGTRTYIRRDGEKGTANTVNTFYRLGTKEVCQGTAVASGNGLDRGVFSPTTARTPIAHPFATEDDE